MKKVCTQEEKIPVPDIRGGLDRSKGPFKYKKPKMSMKMNSHSVPYQGFDWCHLCGVREDYLADIWYPDNAEHSGPNKHYIRICYKCGDRIIHATGVLNTTSGECGLN